MLNDAPQVLKDALKSGAFFYADIVEINLGDVYDQGSDTFFRYTTAGHDISFDSKLYKAGGILLEAGQISRKTGNTPDNIDLVFSATDDTLVKAIQAHKYNNKRCTISRVVLDGSSIVGGYAIPVRSAVAVAHDIDFTSNEPTITLICDTVLGAFNESNAYWLTDADHQRRHPGDLSLKHINEMRRIQGGGEIVYNTDNPEGVISPEAAHIIYGRREVELKHLNRIYHYKGQNKPFGRDNRWYVTNFVLLVSHGVMENVDMANLKFNGNRLNLKKSGSHWANGAWYAYVRDDTNNSKDALDDPNLAFMQGYNGEQIRPRLKGLFNKGMTVIYLRHVQKQHQEDGYKGWLNKAYTFTAPVKGRAVYNPLNGKTEYSTNPALQLADFLADPNFGGGKVGIDVNEDSVKDAARYYENITYKIDGVDQISNIESHQIISTAEPYSKVFDLFESTARLKITDYTGEIRLVPEKPETPSLDFTTDDLIDGITIEGGQLTDRVNRQVLTIQTLVTQGDKVESVNFDCIFPQDTTKGRELYERWLKEDGGRPLESSENAEFIDSTELGLYHAAVLARKSRNIDTAEISPPPISWLLEPYDVITITDEITGQNKKEWRVIEISEEDGQTSLNLEEYDAIVYSPDLEAVTPPEMPPDIPEISPIPNVSNLTFKAMPSDNADAQYYQAVANWDEITDPQLSHYVVRVWNGEPETATPNATEHPFKNYTQKVTTNQHLVTGLKGGEIYTIQVDAVSQSGEISDGSEAATLQIGKPNPPDSVICDVGAYSIGLIPQFKQGNAPAALEDLRYRFLYNATNDVNTAQFFGLGAQATKDGLRPSKIHHFWIYTVTPQGESETPFYQEVTTDDSDLVNQITSVVKSAKGFTWLQTIDKTKWLPDNDPITVECDFTDSKTTWSTAVECTLDPKFGSITATPTKTDPAIDIRVKYPGTSAILIEWEHTASKTVRAQTVTAIPSGSDGADGEGGTSGAITLDNSNSWVKGPNGGAWLPQKRETNAVVEFKAGTKIDRAKVQAKRVDDAGNIEITKTETHPDITINVRNSPSTYPSVDFIHTSGAGENVSFVSIIGGDKGDEGSAGQPGVNGKTIRGLYKLAGTQAPPPPAKGDTQIKGRLDGWEEDPQTAPKGQFVWVTYTFSDEPDSPTGNGEWTASGRHSGSDGTDGKPGQDGQPGPDGMVVRSFYKNQKGQPPAPETETLIPPPPGWSPNPPEVIPKGEKTWVSHTYSATPDSKTGSGKWTEPGQFSGNDGNNGSNGSNGTRGSVHVYVKVPTGAWDPSDEYTKNQFPGKALVNWDTLTQYNQPSEFSMTKYWNGSAWLDVSQIIDGNLIVHGTIGADQIESDSITGAHIQGGTIKGGNIEAGIELSAPRITGGEITGNRLNVLSEIVTGVPSRNEAIFLSVEQPEFRLWTGGEDPSKAPLSISKSGRLKAIDADIQGTVQGSFIKGGHAGFGTGGDHGPDKDFQTYISQDGTLYTNKLRASGIELDAIQGDISVGKTYKMTKNYYFPKSISGWQEPGTPNNKFAWYKKFPAYGRTHLIRIHKLGIIRPTGPSGNVSVFLAYRRNGTGWYTKQISWLSVYVASGKSVTLDTKYINDRLFPGDTYEIRLWGEDVSSTCRFGVGQLFDFDIRPYEQISPPE